MTGSGYNAYAASKLLPDLRDSPFSASQVPGATQECHEVLCFRGFVCLVLVFGLFFNVSIFTLVTRF